MKDSVLDFLKKIVKQNSNSHNKTGVNKVGEMLMQEMSNLELSWERFSHPVKGDLFIARSRENDKGAKILLSGHLDTVFKNNWEININENKFYGPGSMDMKAGLVVIVETLKRLYEQHSLKNIILMLTPDEEDGMAHIDKQKEIYDEVDYALVFEEGSRTVNGLIDSSLRSIVYGRKALSFYEVNIYSKGGHHAKITKEIDRYDALDEMARKIIEIEKLSNFDQGTLVNVGLANSGTSPNSLSEKATIHIDVRYGNRSEINRFKNDFEKLIKKHHKNVRIESEEYLYYPAMDPSPKNKKFANEVVKVGREIDLKIQAEFRSSGSEANWISDTNPSAIVLDGFGVVGDGDHSTEEYFLIDSFDNSVDLTYKTIRKIQNESD